MGMEEKLNQLLIKKECVSFLVVFDQSLVRFFGLLVNSGMVSMTVMGLEIGFSEESLTLLGQPTGENSTDVVNDVIRCSHSLQSLEDQGVMTMGLDMGATNPPNQSSC